MNGETKCFLCGGWTPTEFYPERCFSCEEDIKWQEGFREMQEEYND